MLKYLFDPNIQFLDTAGAINVGGHLEVYLAYTDDAAATFADLSGKATNPKKIPLDSNGRATVAVDGETAYRLEVYERGGMLLWTVQPYMPSGTIVNLPVSVAGTPDEIDVRDATTDEERLYEVSLSETVKDKIEANREASEMLGKLLENETAERKEADKELKKLIDGKQTDLKDGDNIHIDEENKVNVVGRKSLSVESPMTARIDKDTLILGVDVSSYALASDLEKETEARTKGDSQLLSRIDKVDADLNAEILNRIQADSGKQDRYFLFDPNSSTKDDVVSAISAGRNILSASGSNANEWLGSINGGYPHLYRVGDGVLLHWHLDDGQWTQERFDARKPEWARLPLPTTRTTPGTELFGLGKFTVYGYTDNASSLRLVVKPTDGKDHAVYANGGGYRCDAETGSTITTEFTQSKPYLRLYIVDTGYWESDASGKTDTDWTVSEAEIYAFNYTGGGLLYRVITEQGGLSDG